jgi:hypothetical protein
LRGSMRANRIETNNVLKFRVAIREAVKRPSMRFGRSGQG